MAFQLTLVPPAGQSKRPRARRVPLQCGGYVLVDGEDFDRVSKVRWTVDSAGYPVEVGSKWRGARLALHRLVMRAQTGQDVDHKNGDLRDARKQNLRFCTNSLNQANRRKVRARSGIKGVHWHGQQRRWQVLVKCNGKAHYVGLFTDDIAAGRAYLRKARELFGEFAWSNVEQVARERRKAAAQACPVPPLAEAA